MLRPAINRFEADAPTYGSATPGTSNQSWARRTRKRTSSSVPF
jgi:hypothetical protein